MLFPTGILENVQQLLYISARNSIGTKDSKMARKEKKEQECSLEDENAEGTPNKPRTMPEVEIYLSCRCMYPMDEYEQEKRCSFCFIYLLFLCVRLLFILFYICSVQKERACKSNLKYHLL